MQYWDKEPLQNRWFPIYLTMTHRKTTLHITTQEAHTQICMSVNRHTKLNSWNNSFMWSNMFPYYMHHTLIYSWSMNNSGAGVPTPAVENLCPAISASKTKEQTNDPSKGRQMKLWIESGLKLLIPLISHTAISNWT